MQMKIKLSELNLDLQTRAMMDHATIVEYAERMTKGAEFPSVLVVTDGTTNWLADGFHRYHASENCGFVDIECYVFEGGRSDAVKKALEANQAHGLRRTNADKRRCVEMALREFPGYSARQIADMCGVGHQMVDDAKQVAESSTCPPKVKGKDGKSYPAKPVKKSQVHIEAPSVVKFDAEADAELKRAFAPEPGASIKTADEETSAAVSIKMDVLNDLKASFLECERFKQTWQTLQKTHNEKLAACSDEILIEYNVWKKENKPF